MEAVQFMNQLKYIKNYVKLVYKYCVDSVNPKTLIKKELTKKGNSLLIRGKEYQLKNNCYVVGFGKAVLDMALASEDIFGEHIRLGALSVPEGLLSQKPTFPKMIQVFEGAKGNVPDEKAFFASKNIVSIMEKLNEEALLFVLISGGGSALFPYPLAPVTLEEKLFVTETLMKAGADIMEVNAVRKRLSYVKGGKLAKIAHPATTVTLILSDVVNDPLDVIASGPLVPDTMPHTLAMDVLRKYDLVKAIPAHIINILQNKDAEDTRNYFSNVSTYIIGNNSIALKAGEEFAAKDGFVSKAMTNSLIGDTRSVANSFAQLAGLLCQALGKTINSKTFTTEFQKINKELCVSNEAVEDLAKLIFEPSSKNKVCLLFGGETTLKVFGKGVGGRNQEMALRFSIALDQLAKTLHVIDLFNVVILCAGTDGMDGPTDAAGAIAYNGQCKTASLQKLNPSEYLINNDSYFYFSLLDNSEDLFKSGLTGTNVMDINILTVQSRM